MVLAASRSARLACKYQPAVLRDAKKPPSAKTCRGSEKGCQATDDSLYSGCRMQAGRTHPLLVPVEELWPLVLLLPGLAVLVHLHVSPLILLIPPLLEPVRLEAAHALLSLCWLVVHQMEAVFLEIPDWKGDEDFILSGVWRIKKSTSSAQYSQIAAMIIKDEERHM